MNVHQAITAHTQKQHAHLEQFLVLDEARERAIEKAVELCRQNEPFNVEEINEITKQIGRHAQKGICPVRVLITKEMIEEYVNRAKA